MLGKAVATEGEGHWHMTADARVGGFLHIINELNGNKDFRLVRTVTPGIDLTEIHLRFYTNSMMNA